MLLPLPLFKKVASKSGVLFFENRYKEYSLYKMGTFLSKSTSKIEIIKSKIIIKFITFYNFKTKNIDKKGGSNISYMRHIAGGKN